MKSFYATYDSNRFHNKIIFSLPTGLCSCATFCFCLAGFIKKKSLFGFLKQTYAHDCIDLSYFIAHFYERDSIEKASYTLLYDTELCQTIKFYGQTQGQGVGNTRYSMTLSSVRLGKFCGQTLGQGVGNTRYSMTLSSVRVGNFINQSSTMSFLILLFLHHIKMFLAPSSFMTAFDLLRNFFYDISLWVEIHFVQKQKGIDL